MPGMDYFRRPQISGRNLNRLGYATIRGALRRSDADITSPEPYFPGVSPGDTLEVTTDAGVTTATMSGGALSSILTALNTALGAAGAAYEGDGALYLQANTPGALGNIAVTAGTAALNLGFDLTAGVPRSVGGDIPGAPEGRIKNPYGAAFPGKGENFVMDSIRNSLGRIAGNVDVLFANMEQQDAALRQVAMPTPVPLDGTHSLLTLDASLRVFTGFGIGTVPTKESLAPFFILIDQNTKQPAISKVVDVILGTTGSPPPYDLASSWADTGKSLVGRDILKTSAVITSIKDNRVLYCAGATFTTSTKVGDFAKITGADGDVITVPWDNRGYRWAVDQVIDSTHLSLRPMSKTELAAVGFSGNDQQPVLELNDTTLSGGKTYGTVEIRSGSFCQNVSLVVSPAIPAGASYDLWVTTPNQMHGGTSHQTMQDQYPLSTSLVDDTKHQPDGFLTAPTASVVGGNLVLTSFYVRCSGKVYYVPARTLLAALFPTPDDTYFVYWNPYTFQISITDDPSTCLNQPQTQEVLPSPGTIYGQLICKVYNDPDDGLQTPTMEGRKISEVSKHITVGWGGQFDTLESAIAFINDWSSANGETAGATGNFSHYQITLVSDVVVSTPLAITCPGLRIQGANPEITVTCLTNMFSGESSGLLILEDFNLVMSTAGRTLVGNGALSTPHFIIRNVRMPATSPTLSYIAYNSSGAGVTTLSIFDSSFLTDGIFFNPSGNSIDLHNSTFTAGGTNPKMFYNIAGAGWTNGTLFMEKCIFSNWGATDDVPIMANADPTSMNLVVENSVFSPGTFGAHNNAPLLTGGSGVLRQITFTANFPRAVVSAPGMRIYDSQLKTIPNSATIAVDCGVVEGCTIQNSDTGADAGAVVVQASIRVAGNVISGSYKTAVTNSGLTAEPEVVGNVINQQLTATNPMAMTILMSVDNDLVNRVRDNRVHITTAGPIGATGSYILKCTGNSEIDGNILRCDVSRVSSIQIWKPASAAQGMGKVTGNILKTYVATSLYGVDFTTSVHGSISDNVMVLPDFGSGAVGLQFAGTNNVSVTGNYISADKVVGGCSGVNIQMAGNYLQGDVGLSNMGAQIDFHNNTVASGAAYLSVTSGGMGISDNYFAGNVKVWNDAGTQARFFNNYVGGTFTAWNAGATITDFMRVNNNTVVGVADFTGHPYVDVELNRFGSSVAMGVGRFISNYVTGAYTGSSLSTPVSLCSFKSTFTGQAETASNCDFEGATTITCDRFSGNKVSASISISGSTYSVPVVGNVILGDATLSTCSASSNYISGSASISVGQFIGNNVVGDLAPAAAEVSGNKIHGNVLSSNIGAYLEMMGNTIDGYLSVGASTGFPPISITGNSVLGTTGSGVGSDHARLDSNYFAHGLAVWTVTAAGSVTMTGNLIGATNGDIYLNGGGDFFLSGNSFVGRVWLQTVGKCLGSANEFLGGLEAQTATSAVASISLSSCYFSYYSSHAAVQLDCAYTLAQFSSCFVDGDFKSNTNAGSGAGSGLSLSGCTVSGSVLAWNYDYVNGSTTRRTHTTFTGNRFTSTAGTVEIHTGVYNILQGNEIVSAVIFKGCDTNTIIGNQFTGAANIQFSISFGQYLLNNNPSLAVQRVVNSQTTVTGNFINNNYATVDSRCILADYVSGILVSDNSMYKHAGPIFVQFGHAAPGTASEIVYGPNLLDGSSSQEIQDYSSYMAVVPTFTFDWATPTRITASSVAKVSQRGTVAVSTFGGATPPDYVVWAAVVNSSTPTVAQFYWQQYQDTLRVDDGLLLDGAYYLVGGQNPDDANSYPAGTWLQAHQIGSTNYYYFTVVANPNAGYIPTKIIRSEPGRVGVDYYLL